MKLHKSIFILLAVLILLLAQTIPSVAVSCGDTNFDGTVNIADLVYLVDYMFQSGPPPPQMYTTDVNGDGSTYPDIADLVYMVDYMFQGGLAPICATVTDIDGNSYLTVTIGTQIWMAENLKVTHYRNGDAIPNITGGSVWASLITAAYCDYNNDVNNVAIYGRLYNWYAVADSRNIAPEGWHIPTDAEWQTLADYLGGYTVAGGKMKEAGITHWASPNTGATNESGFTARPGGYRAENGAFYDLSNYARYWASIEQSSDSAWSRSLQYYDSEAVHYANTKTIGFSVRCVKGEISLPEVITDTVGGITQTSAKCGGTVTSDGGATVSARGVCWSTSPTPTILDNITSDGAGTGSFTSFITGLTAGTTYYVRAYATNNAGTGYGEEVSFSTLPFDGTVTDIDGNVYQTVTIGTQVWMAENLKVTHYRNGDAIPNVTDGTTWGNLTSGAYCDYNNDVNNVATYGRLYNWYAVADSRNIAPEGWHVPTDAEWQMLADYLGGDVIAGGKMKEVGMEHWIYPNIGATNESGFTALPGGDRSSNGLFYYMGNYAFFWSSTENEERTGLDRYLQNGDAVLGCSSNDKPIGFSVRCVRDVEGVPVVTTADVVDITETTAQCGGTVTSDGGAAVTARGVCWSTNPTPTTADNITTDGAGIGSFTSYITGLATGTAYYVRAYATNSVGTGYGEEILFTTPSGPVTDIDGNVYQTVTIGTQVWMMENLKVTHYRNGDVIPNVTDNTAWYNLTSGAYCNYNNDVNNVATYGRLYNWYAVADGRNIAPEGWHMPTDEEWKQLEMFLGMSETEADVLSWRGTDEGGKLKEAGTTHWLYPNTGATNESGFTALPGGSRFLDGSFYRMGYDAYFWSSTESSSYSAWYRSLDYDNSYVYRNYLNKPFGFSVRCVRD